MAIPSATMLIGYARVRLTNRTPRRRPLLSRWRVRAHLPGEGRWGRWNRPELQRLPIISVKGMSWSSGSWTVCPAPCGCSDDHGADSRGEGRLPQPHRGHRLLFWELFGVNLCSLFGVKLGMQELRSCRQRLGICLSRFRLLESHLESIDLRQTRSSLSTAQLFRAVTPNSEQHLRHMRLTYTHTKPTTSSGQQVTLTDRDRKLLRHTGDRMYQRTGVCVCLLQRSRYVSVQRTEWSRYGR